MDMKYKRRRRNLFVNVRIDKSLWRRGFRHKRQGMLILFYFILFYFILFYFILFYVHWCEGVRTPGAEVTDSCELPCGCWESNQNTLEGQPVLLPAEPALQLSIGAQK